jgi:exodeoxyribonuclease V beta subunit
VTAAFDICGPLPTGVTVLEASAGTGKTFTIAALAARYVAEGIPLDQLLLVTFTRMATGELRERVRERLVSAEQGLARALAGVEPPAGDGVLRLLADADVATVERRRARLERALSDFDAATIATTHGFCQEVLSGLGLQGDTEAGATVVEDFSDLLAEVVDDLYVRRFHRHGQPQFTRAEALAIARIAVENPAAPIDPRDAGPETIAAMRVGLAKAAREELERRKRRLGVLTYDDLLTRLAGALTGEAGPANAARLRERYRVVLVDEFQDTDPVQWAIMREAFGGGDTTLVLIGDPKQAIYAFRGADVYAYLDAARTAGARATLDVNWRSDQRLLDAYDALFASAQLGHPGIGYRTVRAAPPNRRARLSAAPEGAPLRVRVVPRDDPGVALTPAGFAAAPAARELIAQDVAADVARLLSSPATLETRTLHGGAWRTAPVAPGDIAVLVRSHRTGAQVRAALAAAGVPAVIGGAGSVFATEPARDWLKLLEAIERPAHAVLAHTVALTPFLGWNAARVACAADEEWGALHARLHEWAELLRTHGVASLAEAITAAERLPGRILATVEGERALTDLRHVAELLHEAATAEHLGVTALAAWLRRRIAAAEQEGDEERSRRLESDAAAVQVLTIHRSKGLEFPIVYLPFLWEPTWLPEGDVPIGFHDPEAGDARTLDVGLDGPQWAAHKRQHVIEERGEDLRLAYVALTRARHQAVLWWAGSYASRHSALGRLLFARDGEAVRWEGRGTPADAAVFAKLAELADATEGCISAERADAAPRDRWHGAARDARELTVARFGRELDRRWRRTSYSDLTAGAYEARVATEPETPHVVDEPPGARPPAPLALRPDAEEAPAATPRAAAAPALDEGPPADEAALLAVPSLLAGMEGGTRTGTFVHRALERADFAAADLDAELAAAGVQDPAVRHGLRAAIETPLGPLAGDLRLRDIARRDRLDELAFELPLAGADSPRGEVGLDAVAAVLRRHGGALAPYAERLADPALRRRVRGYLTGSLDLVVRLPGGAFAIADYKTNWLAAPGEALTAWHYRPAALAAEMAHAHYGLQAVLYTVALHRYLRWRLPDHDPGRDIAGVVYLFLRGMSGPDTPAVAGERCGVFAWRPAPALVTELSAVLDRGGELTREEAG